MIETHNNQEDVDLALLDFSKAFGSVIHTYSGQTANVQANGVIFARATKCDAPYGSGHPLYTNPR